VSGESPSSDWDCILPSGPAADTQATESALSLFADDGELALAAFTPDCRSALGTASRLASEMGHEEIRSAHLFLGILTRPGSRLQPLIVRSGVQMSVLREAFRRSLSGGPAALAPCRLHRDYLSKNALSAIRRASARAQQRGGHTVTELDLLTALLQREDLVTRVLEEHHVEPAQLLPAFSSRND
jgi:ATP-dependent Clp protease ATP-binding subunit ClpA